MSPFILTKAHIRSSFSPLSETSNLALRSLFFTQTCLPNIKWSVQAPASSLHGTRYSIADHCAATFDRLRPKLKAPICFTIQSIVLDSEEDDTSSKNGGGSGRWAVVELLGRAETKLGTRYDNEYVMFTRWDESGRLAEVRSYFDTLMAEDVMNMTIPLELQVEGEER